jgi:hypothetical protein
VVAGKSAFYLACAEVHDQCRKTLNQVKRIFRAVMLTTTFFFVGCSWFGSPEAYKSESGRTTFRAANEGPAGQPEVTPAPQKIPGESTRP